MAAPTYFQMMTTGLTDQERSMVQQASIKANAPSTDSAVLGAVAAIKLLKEQGLLAQA